MDVRLGLDFGTHQTKACLNYKKGNQPQIYEFFLFDHQDETSFFFPSRICLMEDGTLRFGEIPTNSKKEYKYFKIASAEDKTFRGISGFETEDEKYHSDRYDVLTPEVLSIVYLAWVIGYIQRKFSQEINETKESEKKGLLGKFFQKKQNKIDIEYHTQIGIPTEWSQKRNQWRRRKFEQILYLANKLLKVLSSYKQLERIEIQKLKNQVKKLYEELESKKNNKDWNSIIGEYNLSVFPETAAGLTCLVKEKNLDSGYYSAIDIGGGSSDISYFRVTHNRKIEYLASESLLIASNDLFHSYAKKKETIPDSTEEAQDYLEKIRQENSFELDKDANYREAFEKTFLNLNERFKKIYNSRVYKRFRKEIANQKFDEHDCFVYGGGSLVHKPRKNPKKLFDKILIHDNGNPNSLRATRTYAKVRMLDRITLPFEVKPEAWQKYRSLLLVPLGLSNIQPDQSYDWSERFYKPGEENTLDLKDPGLYDVFHRRWV